MTSAAAAKKLLSTCAWILHIKLFQSWFQAVYLGGSEYLPNLSQNDIIGNYGILENPCV